MENNTKANGAKNEKHKKIQQLKIQMLTWVNKAAANFTKLTTVGASNHSFFSTLVFKIRKMAGVGFVKFNITLKNTLNFKFSCLQN